MINKEKVGKLIATQRKLSNFTQKQLADLLHVSSQAVSKWELGISLPTVDMLYDIAVILNVTVDYLLNTEQIDNRDICYKDTGLDTVQLYSTKSKVQHMLTKSPEVLRAHYIQPTFFRIDTQNMVNPVYAITINVPGSKQRLAQERGYDREICRDLVAKSINQVIQYGLTPKIFQAQIVCGSNDSTQLMKMADALKTACEENDVAFEGMEISAQPVNYLPNQYELSAMLVAVAEESDLLFGESAQRGDVLIALKTEGVEATSFPFIGVMLDRIPELAYSKINENQYYMNEILKDNLAYTKVIHKLKERKIITYMNRIANSILDTGTYLKLPEGLGACINLSHLQIGELYRYMADLDLVGKNYFPYRFSFGIGMLLAVRPERVEEALKVIRETNEGYVIGTIQSNQKNPDDKVWTEGRIRW